MRLLLALLLMLLSLPWASLAQMPPPLVQPGMLFVDLARPVNRLAPLNAGLVGWWLALPGLNESGSTFRDISWNKVHGTLTAMALPGTSTSGWWTQLRRGGWPRGLQFDGTDDYVALGTTPAVLSITGPVTVSAWFRIATAQTARLVYAGLAGNATVYEYSISLNVTPRLSIGWGGTTAITTSTTTLSTNTWIHVVRTRTGSTGAWTGNIYINGKLDISGATAINPAAGTELRFGSRTGGTSFYTSQRRNKQTKGRTCPIWLILKS